MAFVPFVESDQPTMAAFNEKFQEAIEQATDDAVSAAPKIVTGSYVGTDEITKTISFETAPKIVFICGYNMQYPTNTAQIGILFHGYYFITMGALDKNNYIYMETYQEEYGNITLGAPRSATDSSYVANSPGFQYNYYAVF